MSSYRFNSLINLKLTQESGQTSQPPWKHNSDENTDCFDELIYLNIPSIIDELSDETINLNKLPVLLKLSQDKNDLNKKQGLLKRKSIRNLEKSITWTLIWKSSINSLLPMKN